MERDPSDSEIRIGCRPMMRVKQRYRMPSSGLTIQWIHKLK
jgi:hypothetical protein